MEHDCDEVVETFARYAAGEGCSRGRYWMANWWLVGSKGIASDAYREICRLDSRAKQDFIQRVCRFKAWNLRCVYGSQCLAQGMQIWLQRKAAWTVLGGLANQCSRMQGFSKLCMVLNSVDSQKSVRLANVLACKHWSAVVRYHEVDHDVECQLVSLSTRCQPRWILRLCGARVENEVRKRSQLSKGICNGRVSFGDINYVERKSVTVV